MWRRSGKLNLTNELTIINKIYYFTTVSYVSFNLMHVIFFTYFIVKLFKYCPFLTIETISIWCQDPISGKMVVGNQYREIQSQVKQRIILNWFDLYNPKCPEKEYNWILVSINNISTKLSNINPGFMHYLKIVFSVRLRFFFTFLLPFHNNAIFYIFYSGETFE